MMRVTRDERIAAAANAAMTIPTVAPVLRLDFVRRGSTEKKAWEHVSSLFNNCTTAAYQAGNTFVVVTFDKEHHI